MAIVRGNQELDVTFETKAYDFTIKYRLLLGMINFGKSLTFTQARKIADGLNYNDPDN